MPHRNNLAKSSSRNDLSNQCTISNPAGAAVTRSLNSPSLNRTNTYSLFGVKQALTSTTATTSKIAVAYPLLFPMTPLPPTDTRLSTQSRKVFSKSGSDFANLVRSASVSVSPTKSTTISSSDGYGVFAIPDKSKDEVQDIAASRPEGRSNSFVSA